MDGDRAGAMMTSDSGFEAGMRVRLSDDVQDAGRCGSVVGNEVFVRQWWCPVLWDDAEDPDFFKSSCMEPLGGLDAADWRDVLHTLTRRLRDVTDAELGRKAANKWRSDIQAIVGKIASGDMGGLDAGELDEVRHALEEELASTASTNVQARTRLQKIVGKISHEGVSLRPVWQALGREELLAKLYAVAPAAVGGLCDGELDRSGALLGRVRGLVIKHKASAS